MAGWTRTDGRSATLPRPPGRALPAGSRRFGRRALRKTWLLLMTSTGVAAIGLHAGCRLSPLAAAGRPTSPAQAERTIPPAARSRPAVADRAPLPRHRPPELDMLADSALPETAASAAASDPASGAQVQPAARRLDELLLADDALAEPAPPALLSLPDGGPHPTSLEPHPPAVALAAPSPQSRLTSEAAEFQAPVIPAAALTAPVHPAAGVRAAFVEPVEEDGFPATAAAATAATATATAAATARRPTIAELTRRMPTMFRPSDPGPSRQGDNLPWPTW